MKKAICIGVALLLLVVLGIAVSSCGKNDKSKSSSNTESTKAPTTATTATVAATAPTTSSYTLAPVPQATDGDQDDTTAATEEEASETSETTDNGYYGEYGGLSGQDAILQALGYAGSGYQCVSYEKQYLQGQEAWYIGVQAAAGSDETVYYIYVNSDQIVPVSDIPAVGDDSNQPGNYGGVSQKQAVAIALQNVDGNYSCVSYEQVEIDGTQYWRIGLQNNDSGEVSYYLVNNSSCFEE